MTVIQTDALVLGYSEAFLPIRFSGIEFPRACTIGGRAFTLVHQFRVNLISPAHRLVQQIEKEKKLSHNLAYALAADALRKASASANFKVHIGEEVRVLEKRYERPTVHRRETLIVKCEVEGGEAFYRSMTQRTGVTFTTPHFVTLYTLTGHGEISLTTEQELSSLGTVVTPSNIPAQLASQLSLMRGV